MRWWTFRSRDDRIIAQYLVDASPEVKLYSLDGDLMGDVELPDPGSVGGFESTLGDHETFYRFSNHVTPPTTYRLDVQTGESRKVMKSGAFFNSADYVIDRWSFAYGWPRGMARTIPPVPSVK